MSTNPQAYNQYRQSMVETASPGRLLLLLYEAAIRNLDGAKKAMNDNDLIATHTYLVKTQDIVQELKCTLNMDYEISKSLFNIYDFLYNQLVQANIKKNVELIDEVRNFLKDLKETWQEAISKAGGIPGPAAPSDLGSQKPTPVKAKVNQVPGPVQAPRINLRG